ncbi:translation machinery-associated protein 17 [Monosporozyma unispora]|nr:hypothetical protein C6P44_003274 [Kazachstania unispora]
MIKHTASGMKRPVKIREFEVAIREMSNDELKNIRHEIENSLQHLNRSNARLQAYVDKIEGKEQHYEDNELLDDLTTDELDNIDHGDLQLFSDSLMENNIILKNYQERLDALDQENIFRTSGSSEKETKDTKSNTIPNVSTQSQEPNAIYL